MKTQHHPTTSSTLSRMPHLKNKQNKYKPNHQQTGLTTSLSLAHQRKNKQTNKKQKSHPK